MEPDQYNWISKRAHQIWEQEGCPWGRDREHWSQAVADFERMERQKSVDPPPAAAQFSSILFVDDEPLIRFAAVDALEEAGFQVLEAANADEALVLLDNAPVDAVVTDINMPGSMDGLGLVTRIRARSPHTRVIVTSGHVRVGRFDLPSGVSFLPKPYTFHALVELLDASRTGNRSECC